MKSSELPLNLSRQQITLLLLAVGAVVAISIFVGILRFGNKLSERQKQQSKIGLLHDTADWPKPFQELHQQLLMPGGEMTVCNAMGGSRDAGQRVAMCKITGSPATWKVVRQQLGLQRVRKIEGERWRMESSSVRGDFFWWPRIGESAIYYANEDFLNGGKAIHLQAAHCEDTVMYVHCTMESSVPVAKK